jgi:four helix bundle protein
MSEVKDFRDLRVYQELFELHLAVHHLTLTLPKLETYELGSQVRRSSNSAPAQIAEGWGGRHTNIYIEAVSRSLGEVRETQHHLAVAQRKGYVKTEADKSLEPRYIACGRMLEKLYQSLIAWQGSIRQPYQVREERATYGEEDFGSEWEAVVAITLEVMREMP